MKILSVAVISAASCMVGHVNAAPPQNNSMTDSVPEWVNNPVIDDGLSAATCVKSSGRFSVDRKKAVANVRMALAQQIKTNVEGLEKTLANQMDPSVDESFVSASVQLTNESLRGSRAVKFDQAVIDGVKHQCALMILNPAKTQLLFEQLIAKSQRQLTAKQQTVLREMFVNQRTKQRMESEIDRFTR